MKDFVATLRFLDDQGEVIDEVGDVLYEWQPNQGDRGAWHGGDLRFISPRDARVKGVEVLVNGLFIYGIELNAICKKGDYIAIDSLGVEMSGGHCPVCASNSVPSPEEQAYALEGFVKILKETA